MSKIGTRAIISIDGKPMLATHWDGYPTSLGADLLNCDKSVKAVIEVAKIRQSQQSMLFYSF